MGGFIKRDIARVEITALNTKINKELFDAFKDECKYLGYPMNVILESFMQQYKNNRIQINHEDIMKWRHDEGEVDTLNTTFNKSIYKQFKVQCKENGYFVKHVIMAFMELYSRGQLVLEYVYAEEVGFSHDNFMKVKEIKQEEQLQEGFMKCPFCGRIIEATIENWRIMHNVENGKKYLACSDCEGIEAYIPTK